MGRLVYGYWDCSQCGSKGIRGDKRECPNCGRPRSEDTKFYMKNNIEYVPAEKENTVNRNPDWLCSYCNALNSDTLSECKGCGASRIESEKNYFDLQKTKPPSERSEIIQTEYKEDNTGGFYKVKQWFENKNVLKILLSSIVAIAFIFLMFFVFKTHTEEMTVSSFSWERSIEIEKLVTFNESGWSLPYDARLITSVREFKEYTDVFDHYETKTRQVPKQRIVGYDTYVSGYRDLGNGMFEEITAQKPIYETYYDTETYQEAICRKEAVYATKYYYEIDRWMDSHIIRTAGSNKSPYWGNLNSLGEKERVGTKDEKYIVYLLNDDSEICSCSVSYSTWNELSPDDIVEVQVRRWGEVVSIDFPTGEVQECIL